MTAVRGPDRHRAALELAWKALDGRDAEELAARTGGRASSGAVLLPYFERELRVELGNRTVTVDEGAADGPSTILALHYLAACDDQPLTGELAPFNQADGGDTYYQAFKARSIDRLAHEFGGDPPQMISAAERINGREVSVGSGAAAEVRIFPKLVVTAIIWEGDEEIPASANLLFDRYSLRTMPTEDLAVAGSLVATRLIRARG